MFFASFIHFAGSNSPWYSKQISCINEGNILGAFQFRAKVDTWHLYFPFQFFYSSALTGTGWDTFTTYFPSPRIVFISLQFFSSITADWGLRAAEFLTTSLVSILWSDICYTRYNINMINHVHTSHNIGKTTIQNWYDKSCSYIQG